jgi:hypothetical protein
VTHDLAFGRAEIRGGATYVGIAYLGRRGARLIANVESAQVVAAAGDGHEAQG